MLFIHSETAHHLGSTYKIYNNSILNICWHTSLITDLRYYEQNNDWCIFCSDHFITQFALQCQWAYSYMSHLLYIYLCSLGHVQGWSIKDASLLMTTKDLFWLSIINSIVKSAMSFIIYRQNQLYKSWLCRLNDSWSVMYSQHQQYQ